jgi:hypothetical protein
MKEESKKIREWINIKEVQVKLLKQKIEVQKLVLSQIKENEKTGFYSKLKQKEIAEQPNDLKKNLRRLELEQIMRDVEAKFYSRCEELALEDMYAMLKIEEKTLEELEKKYTESERNIKFKEEK